MQVQQNLVAVENAHSRRPRCAYFGELEQMDASPYEWFADHKTTLHIAVMMLLDVSPARGSTARRL